MYHNFFPGVISILSFNSHAHELPFSPPGRMWQQPKSVSRSSSLSPRSPGLPRAGQGRGPLLTVVQLQPGAGMREFNLAQSMVKLKLNPLLQGKTSRSCPVPVGLSGGCSFGNKLVMFWLLCLFYMQTQKE